MKVSGNERKAFLRTLSDDDRKAWEAVEVERVNLRLLIEQFLRAGKRYEAAPEEMMAACVATLELFRIEHEVDHVPALDLATADQIFDELNKRVNNGWTQRFLFAVGKPDGEGTDYRYIAAMDPKHAKDMVAKVLVAAALGEDEEPQA